MKKSIIIYWRLTGFSLFFLGSGGFFSFSTIFGCCCKTKMKENNVFSFGYQDTHTWQMWINEINIQTIFFSFIYDNGNGTVLIFFLFVCANNSYLSLYIAHFTFLAITLSGHNELMWINKKNNNRQFKHLSYLCIFHRVFYR